MLSLGNTMLCFLEILLLAVLFNSQVILAQSSNKGDIDKTEVEKWVFQFHESLFVNMNPRKTFDDYVFVGKLTNIEAESTEREWLNFPNKKVSKELRVRYARLNFERQFYEIFFLFGTKKLSDNFGEINYDDNGFTTIEYVEYAEFLSLKLNENNISKEDYISFFKQDKRPITKQQTINIEKFSDHLSKLIKTKIDKTIYNVNISNFEKLWKIEFEESYKKYFLITNGFGSSFIVGKKDRRIQIIDFPKSIN